MERINEVKSVNACLRTSFLNVCFHIGQTPGVAGESSLCHKLANDIV